MLKHLLYGVNIELAGLATDFCCTATSKGFHSAPATGSDGTETKNAPGARESGGVSWMLSGTSGSRNIHVLGRSTVARPETALVDVASTAASRRPPIPSNPDSRIAAYRNVNPLTRAVFPATTAIDGWRRTPAMTSESIATSPLPREHRSNISVSVSLSIVMKHGCFLC